MTINVSDGNRSDAALHPLRLVAYILVSQIEFFLELAVLLYCVYHKLL